MSIIKVLEKVENDLLEVKKQGEQAVDIDKLLAYLSTIKNSSEVQLEIEKDLARYAHERNLEHYKAKVQNHIANYETLSENLLQQFKSIIDLAQSTLKSAILINGGAAVALLTFIGNSWGKGDGQSVYPILSGISYFAKGALSGAVASALAYFCQLCFSYSGDKKVVLLLENLDKEDPQPMPISKVEIAAYILQAIAIIVTIVSYVLFAFGMTSTSEAFL